ncbi:hypothetical protein trd_A0296 (plasmid) [Thermomicrobium roseum DSM 5159]|uniref:Uncharacterized protein n=1 Tax=Thermomicrobium roseum (strain ATCC 27502 / DSM 5159 / P-2) TaxID=309801 RepID=B9L3D3_THERP|nr:hypothetical protein trd_A0296 [Thermomicrobium roseum DSM 5159]
MPGVTVTRRHPPRIVVAPGTNRPNGDATRVQEVTPLLTSVIESERRSRAEDRSRRRDSGAQRAFGHPRAWSRGTHRVATAPFLVQAIDQPEPRTGQPCLSDRP